MRLNRRIDRAIMDQGTAGRRYEVSLRVEVAGAKFRYLACRAGNRILMALTARLGIVDRPETLADRVHLVEHPGIGIMCYLIYKSVGLPVISRGRFGHCCVLGR